MKMTVVPVVSSVVKELQILAQDPQAQRLVNRVKLGLTLKVKDQAHAWIVLQDIILKVKKAIIVILVVQELITMDHLEEQLNACFVIKELLTLEKEPLLLHIVRSVILDITPQRMVALPVRNVRKGNIILIQVKVIVINHVMHFAHCVLGNLILSVVNVKMILIILILLKVLHVIVWQDIIMIQVKNLLYMW